MIAMTTSSSTSVKPARTLRLQIGMNQTRPDGCETRHSKPLPPKSLSAENSAFRDQRSSVPENATLSWSQNKTVL